MGTQSVIELGTNSLKYLLIRDDEVIFDCNEITRLGENYHKSGIISQKALKRTIKVIKKYQKISEDNNAKVMLVATMILRSAKNNKEVIEQIEAETSLKTRILSGIEEAKFSYLAALKTLNISSDTAAIVVDSGGGSTEIIQGDEGKIILSQSFNIGAVTLSEEFNLTNEVSAKDIKLCQNKIDKCLSDLCEKNDSGKFMLIGVGGTITTISAIIQELAVYNQDKVQGSAINYSDIYSLVLELAQMPLSEKKEIIGLSEKRADIILGGAIIFKQIMQILEIDEIIVCDKGLRYGLLL